MWKVYALCALFSIGAMASAWRLKSGPTGKINRWILICCLVLNSASASFDLAVISLSLYEGCFPWSPKDVPFVQGMTLCPGQTAHGPPIDPDVYLRELNKLGNATADGARPQ